MKKRMLSLFLTLVMVMTMTPAAFAAEQSQQGRAGGTPSGFLKAVSMPLMPARTSGLYDAPDEPLPAVDGQDFQKTFDGWKPTMIEDGLPVTVSAPDPAAVSISTAEDLKKMEQGGSFVLTQDIDMTDVKWTPLHVKGSVTLDGQGHTIKGFHYEALYGETLGFFAGVEKGLTIQNLRWEDVVFTHHYDKSTSYGHAMGAIVGDVRNGAATFRNMTADIEIVQAGTMQSQTGGLIGSAEESLVVEDCAVSVIYRRAAELAGTAVECLGSFGGIVGASDKSQLDRVYVQVDFQAEDMGKNNIGGIFGGISAAEIKNTMVTGKIDSQCGIVGGVAGSSINSVMRMENCVSAVNISGANIVGGFNGKLRQYCHAEYKNCRYFGTITPYASGVNAGGFVGQQEISSVIAWNCSADVKIQPPVQKAAAPTLTGAIGGIVALSSSSSWDCIGCNVRLLADGLHNKGLELGGLSGSEVYGCSGYGEDCYAEVAVRETDIYGYARVGGLMGYNREGILLNCGAKVEIDLTNKAEYGVDLAGLTGYSHDGVKMSRCYATGSIELDYNSRDSGEAAVAMGGLLGSGMTDASTALIQCYAKVNLKVHNSHTANGTEIGGLAGNLNYYGSVASSWCDAILNCTNDDKTNEYGYSTMAGSIGGLVGSGGTSFTDSAFTGKLISCYGNCIGGINGNCWGGALYRNCYTNTSISTGEMQGGIVGTAEDTSFFDCYFGGSLTNSEEMAGGIVGELYGGNIYRCKAAGTVESKDNQVGGIVAGADISNLADCTFSGTVRGAVVGGILGKGHCDSIRNCTVDGKLNYSLDEEDSFYIGGILGIDTGWTVFENCEMKQSISIASTPETWGVDYAGGICGEGGGSFLNCTSKGVVLSGSGREFSANLGGICGSGEDGAKFENCRVNGAVGANARTGDLMIGGIVSDLGEGTVKNCSVTGKVHGALRPNKKTDSSGEIYTGGIVGRGGWELILSNCYQSGGISASSTHEDTSIYKGALVGDDDFRNESIGSMDSQEKGDEIYTIRVFWYPEKFEIGETLTQYIDNSPLEGATVWINGQRVGVTGPDGTVTVQSKDVPQSGSTVVKATREGYFETEKSAVLANNGVLTINMKKKTPGTIYLKSVELTVGDGEPRDVLNNKNKTYLRHLSSPSQVIHVALDWNDLKSGGRKLILQNKDGSKQLEIYDNVDYPVNLHTFFDKEEDIYLQAKGVDREGKPVETLLYRLAISIIEIKAELNIEGEKHPVEGLEWMDGVEVGFELGEFLQHATEVQISDNVITFQFGNKSDVPEAVLTSSNLEIAVDGNLMLTFNEEGLDKWLGDVRVSGSLNPLYENVVQIKSAPVLITTEISGGLAVGLGVTGEYENPLLEFPAVVKVDARFAVGAGVGTDDFYIMPLAVELGGTGEAVLHIQPVDPEDDNGGHVDAKLEGYIGFTARCKGHEKVELDANYKIGGFRWESGKGAVFFSPNDEIPLSALSMDSEEWTAMERAYLNNGGGFCSGVQLLSEQDSGGPVRVYENIMAASGSGLAVENGVPVLYFTADDGKESQSGGVSEHTALWRSQRKNGVWTEPAVVSGSEAGYPDGVSADGPFAVWVNSPETGSFQDMLTSTDVVVAMNGSVIGTFDGEGYVYGAKVAASANGTSAMVTWLRDEKVDSTNLIPSTSELHYAIYKNGKWTKGQVETSGQILVKAMPRMVGGEAIFWQTENGSLMRATGRNFDSVTSMANGVYNAVIAGDYAASMGEDGMLTIWQDGFVEAVLPTNGSALSDPALVRADSGTVFAVWAAADGIYYADGASAWSAVKKLCQTESLVTGLSAAIADGKLCVSYTKLDKAGETPDQSVVSLYVAQAPDLTGVDLAVTSLEAMEDDLGKTGVLDLSAVVTNLRETAVTDFTYSVTDEAGTVVCGGTRDELNLTYGMEVACRSIFAPDVTAPHSYTLTVQPVGAEDADPSNNTMTIQMQPDPGIFRTGFQSGLGTTTELEVLVTNRGAAPAQSMTVEIYRMTKDLEKLGDPLISQVFTDVAAGSYRQVLLEDVSSNVYYYAELYHGDELVDQTLLMWQDEYDTAARLSYVTFEEDRAVVQLVEQGDTKDTLVVLAFYDSDTRQLISAKTADLNGGYEAEIKLTADLDGCDYKAFLADKETMSPLDKPIDGTVRKAQSKK